jgi:hypothetical protein
VARDYESSPEADGLGLKGVILGLAADIEDLRAGKISPHDALARAAVAKQLFNGVRLYVQASRFIGESAKPAQGALAKDDDA